MTHKIKLDIISDVTCPWCIIGYKRVEKAISEMMIQDAVEIEWHPFELNPEMSIEGEDVRAHIAKKYGTTPDDTRLTLEQITSHGKELGVTIDFFDEFKMINTQNLHILLAYAKESGKQTTLKMRLFEALFSERKDLSNQEVLIHELQKTGLEVNEALARLDDATVRSQVKDHETYWKDSGVSAVPTMFFNNSRSLVGAQPVSIYKQVFAGLLEG